MHLPIYTLSLNGILSKIYTDNWCRRFLGNKYQSIKLSKYFTGKELYKRDLKMGKIIKYNKFVDLNIYGIKVYFCYPGCIFLNFNGDLYKFYNNTQTLINVDVDDINTNIYCKNNVLYIFIHNSRKWTQIILPQKIIKLGYMENFTAALTSTGIYTYDIYSYQNFIPISNVRQMTDNFILTNQEELFQINYITNDLIKISNNVSHLYQYGYRKNNKLYLLIFENTSDDIWFSHHQIFMSNVSDIIEYRGNFMYLIDNTLVDNDYEVPNIISVSVNHPGLYLIQSINI